MPELPEVETVVRTLETLIKDQKIVRINVLYPNIIEGDVNDFKRRLTGQTFRNFKRRGKYLLFEMDDVLLVSHLRMEGKYYVLDDDTPYNKHTHIIFKLANGKSLQYNDVRKFGRMYLDKIEENYEVFRDLGPEPWSKNFNVDYVKSKLVNNKKPIKTVLLDQGFVSGIGNIYADEILFKCEVDPRTIANKLEEKDYLNIIKYTKATLKKAIEAGGTTIRSYTSSLGVTGLFQLSLNVHQRVNEPCPKCNTTIIKTVVGGRGTYICPTCQKLK